MPRIADGPDHVGVFGGSFDPPHVAHVMAVSWVLSCTPCRQVLVLPCYRHAFAKDSAPFADRVALARAAFKPFGHRVHVSSLEQRLPAPSYTVETLRHLVAAHPGTTFHLVIGTDILGESDRWKDFDEVVRLAPPIVLARGAPDPRARGPVFPDWSSTQIRAALAAGQDVSDRVPAPVLEMARARGLYRPEGRP